MLPSLFLAFTLIPLLDLWLLLKIGSHVGFWPTLALVVVPSALGAAMAKREGLRVLRSWTEAVSQGRMPEEGIISGVLVIAGAVLLITPGLITDTAGLLLLFAPTRKLAAAVVRWRLSRRFFVVSTIGRHYARRRNARARDQVIEVEPTNRQGPGNQDEPRA